MRKWIKVAALLALGAVLSLQGLRLYDIHAERVAWSELADEPSTTPKTFEPAMVADLPDPARRYFLYAIAPGARLSDRVELKMSGQISLGTRAKPDYMPMRARQILAGADGFIWRVRAGSGKMWFSGSDGYARGKGWTRFWLYDAIPVVRAGGDADYARSAAGRSIAESLFWVPAALLPSPTVRWEAVDGDTARAIVNHGGEEHRLEITVAPDGRPLAVSIMRWSRENPDHVWRLQPFGGTVGDIRHVDGYRIAGSVEGGNGFGTDDYFAFYRARLERIRFL